MVIDVARSRNRIGNPRERGNLGKVLVKKGVLLKNTVAAYEFEDTIESRFLQPSTFQNSR